MILPAIIQANNDNLSVPLIYIEVAVLMFGAFMIGYFFAYYYQKSRYVKKVNLLRQKYSDKPWEWGYCGISENSNLTLEWIEKFPDKNWEWGSWGISSNKFDGPYYQEKKRMQSTHEYINKIKDELLAITWAPYRVKSWCLDIDEQVNIEQFKD